ncbi:MAG: M48 family metallopeptidase [Clostridia bacterium]|nr:M48 family metallopeptidase [Clostridia bacterium]
MIPANPQDYLHELDRKALRELKRIPVFDKVCSKFIQLFDEKIYGMTDMASKIRLSEEQVPKIYNMLPDICEKLGIEIPPIYLELNRDPNAYTYGDKKPSITVTSGLLECCNDEEVYAVLAHECGHIACQHVLYHTMGQIILNGGLELIGGGSFLSAAVATSLKLAFFYWMRCSEFSADRAAVICCGKSEPVVQTMMRLAGGTSHIGDEINRDLFVAQAEDYQELRNSSKLNKFIEFCVLSNQTHPLLSVRAYESIQFLESEQYQNVINHMNGIVDEPKPSAKPTTRCQSCNGIVPPNAVFCPHCGTKQEQQDMATAGK